MHYTSLNIYIVYNRQQNRKKPLKSQSKPFIPKLKNIPWFYEDVPILQQSEIIMKYVMDYGSSTLSTILKLFMNTLDFIGPVPLRPCKITAWTSKGQNPKMSNIIEPHILNHGQRKLWISRYISLSSVR